MCTCIPFFCCCCCFQFLLFFLLSVFSTFLADRSIKCCIKRSVVCEYECFFLLHFGFGSQSTHSAMRRDVISSVPCDDLLLLKCSGVLRFIYTHSIFECIRDAIKNAQSDFAFALVLFFFFYFSFSLHTVRLLCLFFLCRACSKCLHSSKGFKSFVMCGFNILNL